MTKEEKWLEEAGVKPTANRVLVIRELAGASRPMSMGELEATIGTLDKSSVQRVLVVLSEHRLVHELEDGRGVTKYELCASPNHHSESDRHVHFYCEKCHEVFCFDEVAVPAIVLPEGFESHDVNYMIKGTCPKCRK
ncbi:MAG: transcriptional repressor [Muribaculaceae bacterium]|nr:transcriptional repressor [Muribaculaceae bacterium]